MFDSERWGEIWATLKSNKLRSGLTMFGVFWGIFMLVIMLGMGKGLSNGVMKGFSGWATNSFFMWTQPTTIPYAGFKRGRRFGFNNDDIAIIQSIPGVEYVAPRLQLGGYRGEDNVTYKGNSGGFSISGDLPVVLHFQPSDITNGRFLNQKDVRDERKVCAIGSEVVSTLFGTEDPIGKYLQIQGVYFQVVGVHHRAASAMRDDGANSTIYIPFSTFQKAFNSVNRVHFFAVSAQPGVSAESLQEKVRLEMARQHKVSPDDPMAFGGFNLQEVFDQMNGLFLAIGALSWFVGSLTLIAGVIGIGNIMLVMVKERTKEIGIRRSVGARPINISSQIMLEALTLTFVAGYFGLLAGIGVLETINALDIQGDFFINPGVTLGVAVAALLILITGGLIAGYIPAKRALSIKPVDALRDE